MLCGEDEVGRRNSGLIAYSDILAFGIAGDCRATALLEAEIWVETVTEGGRRFMVTWRK